ncbi:MAG: SDR family oxidoreductase [Gammaproteobacteria bacterium]|nr:SDR family oxidoreductase [Gammaproteobacteria bacterium]
MNLTQDIFAMQGEVAVVTGGAGYLGAAMCDALLSKGATVVVAARSQEKFHARFGSGYENDPIHFIPCDICEKAAFTDLYGEVAQRFGRIDVVVNNANSVRGIGSHEISDSDWEYTLNGVLGQVQRSIVAVIPLMRQQQRGSIINIASMYGSVSPDFTLYQGEGCEKYTSPPHYGAAKAAVLQLTRYYASLLGREGIRVNAIAPGPFPVAAIREANPVFLQRLQNKTVTGKLGQPEDIMGLVLLLASSASQFITGQQIAIDGGWTIQ